MRTQAFRWVAVLLFPALIQGGLFSACSYFTDETMPHPKAAPWMSRPHGHGMVAILPFKNETDVPDIAVLNRESFYSQFSALNYYDLELTQVDRALRMAEKHSGKPWTALPPQQLGEILHADLLIYGTVKAWTNTSWAFMPRLPWKWQFRWWTARPEKPDGKPPY